MSKEQLLQELAATFEQFIHTTSEAVQRGLTRQVDGWGPREVAAHLAGWEIMATVRVPKIAAGMPLLEFANDAQQNAMDDAINATIVAMIGDQSLDTIYVILRQAYQRDIEMLKNLDDALFRPGNYVYERTRGAIEHCQEHMQGLVETH